jgi:hypothetical protein
MVETYHDKLIQIFCNNLDYFKKYFSFEINSYNLNTFYHPKTEIDIILNGKNNQTALIEVKSNVNGQGKFLTKQFSQYRHYDSKASVYLFFGNKEESLNLEDLTLQKYHPIS